MNILITGSTGYIGNLLALRLADEGHFIHALIRDQQKSWLVRHKNIRVFLGDLANEEDVRTAMEGCEQVYHVAGQVRPWLKNADLFYKTNVTGTVNVCEEAIHLGIKKLVFTSTTGVFGSTNNELFDERASRKQSFLLDYDRSKALAENAVLDYVQNGLKAVIVSPCKVFGPGHTAHSLAANAIICSFLKNQVAFIPSPGRYCVCFSYVQDVVNGHVLAMEKGAVGEKYILGGYNLSYYQFFDRLRNLAKIKGRIICVPKPLVIFAGYLQEVKEKILDGNILFTAKAAKQVFHNYAFSSEKAIKHLGYTTTPLEEAMNKTIQFLKTSS